jgi:pimeloyl-ACP methyl ester carboxylesterase
MRLFATLISLVALGACAAGEPSPCDQAREHVWECTGELPAEPAEGCVGEFSAAADEVLATTCDELTASDKADFWCNAFTQWLGLCSANAPLEEVVAIDSLADVCPSNRGDQLCAVLRDASQAGDQAARELVDAAKELVAERLRTELRQAVLADSAVRYFIRDRIVAKFIANAAVSRGQSGSTPAASELLREFYPAYDSGEFIQARLGIEVTGEKCAPQALLIFPGVVRMKERTEFLGQIAALEEALPCLRVVRIETGSFVHPQENAKVAAAAVARLDDELGPVPLHLLGYSQGALNALMTLVEFPQIAQRTRSVVTLNAAAGGSEVADLGLKILRDGNCDGVPDFMRATCSWAAAGTASVKGFFLMRLFEAVGIPEEDVDDVIAAEDGVEDGDAEAFFHRHHDGIESLTTESAAEFWQRRGPELPGNVLYVSFATIITDKQRNLPPSNAAFFALLERAGVPVPYNDMQVRVNNQRLRGAVADIEVRMPVAEGNHWMWELSDVDPALMSREMVERTPQNEMMLAYYQVMLELGLL